MEARFLLNLNVNSFNRASLASLCFRRFVLAGALSAAFTGSFATAQVVKAPRYTGGSAEVPAPLPQLNLPPLPAAITPHGTVVEDVVVRVNDQIISRSDIERAEEQFQQEAAQNHASPEDMDRAQKNLLRDMIDKQLLISRAKELGLNADADVIRQLDDIRKQNHMDSLDDLERAAKQQGISFEDFKAQIRNQILTQQVVREEVGRRLQMSQADETNYYNAHKAEFDQPEQVHLSEILVPLSETATPAEIATAEAKAAGLKARVAAGETFADVARKYSGGPSAAQGGDLGAFKRGALAKVLEDATFSLPVGSATAPIRTRQGFVVLKVSAHDQPGPAPMEQVEQQIQEQLYTQAMQPALRAYLTKLRNESYVDVQSGFVDSGATASETRPVFTAYAPPPVKKKVQRQPTRFDRRTGAVVADKAVVASPDTTGGRTLTGAEAKVEPTPTTTAAVDPNTGLGVISVPGKRGKSANGKAPKLAKKEKIRFGQAPRNSLPAGTDDTPTASVDGGAVQAGTTTALARATTPTVPNNEAARPPANLDDNPLTPVAPPREKTRFASKAAEVKVKKATTVSARQAEKVSTKPLTRTSDEAATAKAQAAPLGLNGDTSKKPKKPKKVKGAQKERLEDKKPVKKAAPTPVEQTASPTLAPTDATPPVTKPNQTPPVLNSSVPRPASSIPNDTMLPPVTRPVPGSAQPGSPAPPPGF